MIKICTNLVSLNSTLTPEYLWQTKLALKDIKLSKYYDQGYRINHILPGTLKSEIAVVP